MCPEQIETRSSVLPNVLTDRELIRFADRYLQTTGLPSDYQRELLKRFNYIVNKK
jgi:hypothetical protein